MYVLLRKVDNKKKEPRMGPTFYKPFLHNKGCKGSILGQTKVTSIGNDSLVQYW